MAEVCEFDLNDYADKTVEFVNVIGKYTDSFSKEEKEIIEDFCGQTHAVVTVLCDLAQNMEVKDDI